MLFPDESYDQQIKSYKRTVPEDKRNDSIIFQYSITHIEVDIRCDDKAAVMNGKEMNDEKIDATVAFINYKRPYDDSEDEYFLADIPDNHDIIYYEFTKNNNNHKKNDIKKINHNIVNKYNYDGNSKINDNGNSKNKNNGNNNTKKKKKNTFVTMVYSLLQLKHRIKMI